MAHGKGLAVCSHLIPKPPGRDNGARHYLCLLRPSPTLPSLRPALVQPMPRRMVRGLLKEVEHSVHVLARDLVHCRPHACQHMGDIMLESVMRILTASDIALLS